MWLREEKGWFGFHRFGTVADPNYSVEIADGDAEARYHWSGGYDDCQYRYLAR